MSYFDKEYVKFFKNLEANNTREWFQENKKTYEKKVKEPFNQFITDLIDSMRDVYPNLTETAKEAIFRINRDIRFSADKSPYKTHMAAIISPWGKKNHTRPGMYIQVNHQDLRVYSGAHEMDKNQLMNLRESIAGNLKEFEKLISDKAFVEVFGEVRGEKNKRLPNKDLQEIAEKQPLLFNKNFYYFFQFDTNSLYDEKLIEKIISNYKKAIPLNEFIDKGMGN